MYGHCQPNISSDGPTPVRSLVGAAFSHWVLLGADLQPF